MKYNLLHLFLISSFIVFSQSGKVIKVKDGDTIVILDSDNVQHTIRVADIDCPEKGQPFSKAATSFVSNEIFGKEVSIEKKSKDRYGRIIGNVFYTNKTLSKELLRKGLAWHYKYYSKDKELATLELIAKKNKLGLWADPNPINPYQWRKGKR